MSQNENNNAAPANPTEEVNSRQDFKAMYEAAAAKIEKLKASGKALIEKNLELTQYDSIREREAILRHDLRVAKEFADSGVFGKNRNAHEIYTIMKAGEEIGLTPIRSITTLYSINGRIEPHSAGMIAILTEKNYVPTYVDSNDGNVETCTVTITSPEGKVYVEEVRADDSILVGNLEKGGNNKGSNALKISSEHKLRFHGIRKILTFHLPHLMKSVSTDYSSVENSSFAAKIEAIKGNYNPASSTKIEGESATVNIIDEPIADAEVVEERIGIVQQAKDLFG